MKCHVHQQVDAVSNCSDCTRGLCSSCTSTFNPPLCINCVEIRANQEKGVYFRNLVLMIGLFIGGMIYNLPSSGSFFNALFPSYIIASIPWGWSFLSRITPNMFLFMPLIGWVIYLIFKLTLSALVGVFVTPFKVYETIMGLKRISNITKGV